MTKTKHMKAWLVIHWQQENLKIRKTKPTDLSPYQIPVKVDLEIEVPEVEIPELSAKLEVKQAQIHRILQSEVTDEYLLEWQEEVEEILYDPLEQEGPVTVAQQRAWVGQVVLAAAGVPDPEKVLEYIRSRLDEEGLYYE